MPGQSSAHSRLPVPARPCQTLAAPAHPCPATLLTLSRGSLISTLFLAIDLTSRSRPHVSAGLVFTLPCFPSFLVQLLFTRFDNTAHTLYFPPSSLPFASIVESSRFLPLASLLSLAPWSLVQELPFDSRYTFQDRLSLFCKFTVATPAACVLLSTTFHWPGFSALSSTPYSHSQRSIVQCIVDTQILLHCEYPIPFFTVSNSIVNRYIVMYSR